jgi:hypothetical protein
VKLAGSVIFGDPGQSTYSSALPLVSAFPSSLVFSQVASNKDYYTGIAIMNPNAANATATIEIFRKDGSLLISKQELIPAKGRKSQLLTEYFPDLMGQEILAGYIRITANKGLAAFALFGTGTALSAIPPQILR